MTLPRAVERPELPPAPILVAGLGRAGRSAIRALLPVVGPSFIWAWDGEATRDNRTTQRALEQQGIRTWLGPLPGRRQIRWIRTVVKSPGIPFDSALVQRAGAAGVDVLDELELGWRMTSAPMVAVTGTNGKSTVAGLISAILSAAGRRVELAGNTEFGVPLTTGSGIRDWTVCEVSSFQLEGCDRLLPEIGVFTNLTPDHLGRHRTMERYGACKRRLFVVGDRPAPAAVINVDDPFGRMLANELQGLGSRVIRIGFSNGSDYRIDSARWDLRRAVTTIAGPFGDVELNTALPGRYNARNLALALAVADLARIERRVSVHTLGAHRGVPGRFDHVDGAQPFEVIIDFAGTPDAMGRFLGAVRGAMRPRARLITVLGLGGPTGTRMREVGRLARERSDRLVLTTCGAHGYPAIPPLKDLLAGARSVSGAELEVVLDRRTAIANALGSARADDVVVIPGRGAARHMLFDRRGIPIPFDDRQVAHELLECLPAHACARADTPQSVTDTPHPFSTARSPSNAV